MYPGRPPSEKSESSASPAPFFPSAQVRPPFAPQFRDPPPPFSVPASVGSFQQSSGYIRPNPPTQPPVRPPKAKSRKLQTPISQNSLPTIPNPPPPIVSLAADAIRYDHSTHLQQRVAMYRYRDQNYQQMQTRPTPIPKPTPRTNRLQPITVICEQDDSTSQFRHLPNSSLIQAGSLSESLVPIRLDIESGGLHLADTFTWNLHDKFISVDVFADGLCKDLQLPHTFREPVIESIKTQLQDYAQHGQKGDERMQFMSELVDTRLSELRILIKLDITVGRVSLVDQFEWDILCPLNSPETFAAILSADLGLGGEFTTAIAHAIREQVYGFTKSLVLLGYDFDGAPITDPSLSTGFLAPVSQALRDRVSTEKFTPILVELTETELARQAKSKEREHRRNRRQVRARRRPGGTTLLPEREPIATRRTLPKIQAEFCPSPFPKGDPAALGGNPPPSPLQTYLINTP